MHESDMKFHMEKSMQFLFLEIHRHHVGKCFQRLGEFGIHPSQMPFMMMVHKYDGCSQREMAEMLDIKPPTVNVSIQRLEKSGIVYRKRDEKDQRIMRVYLTEKGKKIVADIVEYGAETEKIMFQNFSEAELCLLRRFLGQILTNLDDIPGESVKECKFLKKEGLDE